MNVDTGSFATARDLDSMKQEERDRYVAVPSRFEAAARAHYERGESAYVAAPRSALARLGRKALRDKTRANKAVRKQRRRS